jgi:hypothetical protein
MKEVPEDVQSALKELLDHFDREDRAVRERQIRTWRKMKLYWDGFQRVYYSEVAHDWRIYDESAKDYDQAYYDKPINVFKAYLESIVAALSVSIPMIDCTPDSADDMLDLATAKAGKKIAQLIYKHNDAQLLWLKALYIYCTEGLVFAHHYAREDVEYGTYEEKEYKDTTYEGYRCPVCGNETTTPTIETEPYTGAETYHCPDCEAQLSPGLDITQMVETEMVGVTEHPKSRQCIEVYGGLNVKISNYTRKQADLPYLVFSYETHFSNALHRYYDKLKDKVKKISELTPSTSAGYDPYEAWGRLSPQYRGEYPINTVTVRNAWFRPSSFCTLSEEKKDLLDKHFPDGAKVIFVNELFCDAYNECLDDAWTLTENPMSDYLHHDPIGLLLTAPQDITNELVSLILQTIEQGIPQVMADPGVLDFNAYRNQEIAPGSIFPATPKTGKTLGDSFFEVKTATLSAEVLPFAQKIQELAQLVSGALPSLFGGASSAAGSRTAAEYGMSRAQALQRLNTTWKFFIIWWKNIFGKVIPAYIEDMQEDEKFTVKDEQGNYVNMFIKRAELQGKIGSIELEASEQMPGTWAQKRDVVMQLLQAGNPLVMESMTSPENIPLIREALGLTDFVIPGEEFRNKQYDEIQILLQSGPMLPEMSTVDVDPLLDKHEVEFEVCRHWLVSEAGRRAKVENPEGYLNVLTHMRQHAQNIAPPAALAGPPPGMMQGGGKPQNQGLASPSKGNVGGKRDYSAA